MTTQGKRIAYIRVNTQEQNTESQKEILKQYAKENKIHSMGFKEDYN